MTRKTDTTGLVTPGRYIDHQEGLYHSIILSQSQYFEKKIYIYQIVSEVFIDERHKFSVQNIILVLTNFLKSHGQTVSRFDDLDDKTPR